MGVIEACRHVIGSDSSQDSSLDDLNNGVILFFTKGSSLRQLVGTGLEFLLFSRHSFAKFSQTFSTTSTTSILHPFYEPAFEIIVYRLLLAKCRLLRQLNSSKPWLPTRWNPFLSQPSTDPSAFNYGPTSTPYTPQSRVSVPTSSSSYQERRLCRP